MSGDYSWMIFTLLVRSAIGEGPVPNTTTIRDSAVARAATQRALELYLDVAVHEDCGEGLAVGLVLLHTLVKVGGSVLLARARVRAII